MSKLISRRNFLKTCALVGAAAGVNNTVLASSHSADSSVKNQEYYEIRIYRTRNKKKRKMLENYLKGALLPALNRMGIDRIGVFTDMKNRRDYSVYLLIPYVTLEMFAAVNAKLLEDKEYQAAAEAYFSVQKRDPIFTRIQSHFYKAFAGMPVIEMPAQTAGNKARIFEMRVYESHTEDKAALKVEMFNSGEIQVMRDAGLAPVFFGEALIGDDLPNLVYMLSASDMKAHKAHGDKFNAHPEWQRMKDLPKYADTVSKITIYFLKPTAYSQI